MESIESVLMSRDGMTADEADLAVHDAKEDLIELLEAGDTEGAYEICADHFGLEPDYIDQLLM